MAKSTRAKNPEELEKIKKLKLLSSGPSGSGKSSLIASFPRCLVFDSELGMSHYAALLKSSGSSVIQTNDPKVILEEVRLLMTGDHDYLTVAIDPCTNIWHEEIDNAESAVGDEYGKHYSKAGRNTRRLVNLLMRLDMNIIFSAHQKEVWGKKGEIDHYTFDGWKQSDYIFDLWLQHKAELIDSAAGKRVVFSAIVRKTRLEGFPTFSEIQLGESDSSGNKKIYSYDVIAERFGRALLESAPGKIEFATAEQVAETKALIEKVMPAKTWFDAVYKWAGAEEFADFSREQIEVVLKRLKEMRSI